MTQDKLRPDVLAFATAMQNRMDAKEKEHGSENNWKDKKPIELFEMLEDKQNDLWILVANGNFPYSMIMKYCVDVADFAMMITVQTGALKAQDVQRIPNQQYAEWIGAGLKIIPPKIRELVQDVDFLAGVDPFFVGLHNFKEKGPLTKRSYHVVPHVSYGRYHQNHLPKSRRRTTVCLPVIHGYETEPTLASLWVIIHEVGHVLDEVLGFSYTPKPVTEYAKTDRMEAFACAFEAWFSKGYPDYEALCSKDPATVALFERIAYSK